MTFPILLFAVALVLALIGEFEAQGRSLVGWAAVAIAVGLLWGQLAK